MVSWAIISFSENKLSRWLIYWVGRSVSKAGRLKFFSSFTSLQWIIEINSSYFLLLFMKTVCPTLMLPPHIAERTRLDSTTNESPDMYPSTHRDHTARLSFEWEELKMEDAQVAAAAFYLISAYNYYLTYHRQRVRKPRQNRTWWMIAKNPSITS
jgi:hypothetical protein